MMQRMWLIGNDCETLWPNYGLSGGLMELGATTRGKAAMVLVLLAKDVVSLQINTEIGKS